MSNLSKKYSQRSTYQMIVDSFEKDGAICNFSKKSYDEQKTYEGGSGYRNLFKQVNDEIIINHKILECLTGEVKANIYESIPSIDYLNYENTSLLKTYPLNKDGTVNVSRITSSENNEKSALWLIENEDKFTLNRAVLGFDTAEHFYNTAGPASSCTDLQVSYCTGSSKYLYRGERLRNQITNLMNNFEGTIPEIYQNDTYVYKITATSTINNIQYASVSAPSLPSNLHLTFKSSGTSIQVVEGDVIVVIPKKDFSNNYSKVLVFSPSNTHEPNTLRYVTNTNIDDSCIAEAYKLENGDVLMSFLRESPIIDILDYFLYLDKVYESDASGLLNGLFSEPLEWSDFGDYRKVTKWKLSNDVDIAAKDYISIEIGSNYNNGHLIGSGSIIASPLALSQKDADSLGYSSVSALENDGIIGKASYFYKCFGSNNAEVFMNKIFHNYMKTDWDSFNSNPITIQSLVTQYDYTKGFNRSSLGKEYNNIVNPNEEMKYSEKLTSLSSILTTENIEKYFNDFKRIISGSGDNITLNFHSTYDNVIIDFHYMRIRDNWIERVFSSQQWTGDWIEVEEWGKSKNTHPGKTIENSFFQSCYVTYTNQYWYDYDYRERRDISCSMITPFELFSKKNSNAEAILVYPSNKEDFPNKIYLLTKRKISNLSASDIKGEFIFLNHEKNTIFFQVDKMYDFTLGSSTTTVNVNLKDSDHTNFNTEINTSGRSCYAYVLTTATIDLSNESITIYDTQGKPINLSSDLKIIGASTPLEYFKLISKLDNTGSLTSYVVDQDYVNMSFGELKVSSIFIGIPYFDSNKALYNKKNSYSGIKRNFLESIYNIFTSQNAISNTISSKLLFKLLSDTRVTSDGLFSVKLSGLSNYLKSLLTIVDYVKSNNISILKYGKVTEIGEKDFSKLIDRIIKNKSDYDYTTTKIELGDFDDNFSSYTTLNAAATNCIETNIATSSYSLNGHRQPIQTIIDTLDKFFSSSSLSFEECQNLDKIFGNNTEPVISIGNSSIDMSNEISGAVNMILDKYYNYLFKAYMHYAYSDITNDIEYNDIASKAVIVVKNYVSKAVEIREINNGKKIIVKIPTLSDKSLVDSSEKEVATFSNINFTSILDTDIFEGIADFIKASLYGVNDNGTYSLLKYVSGDEELTGEKNGLYHKRYNVLNSRMNRVNGPLYQAGLYFQNLKPLEKATDATSYTYNVYSDFMDAMPISSLEPLSYIPTQEASETQIDLPGKFYSDKEMEALRNQINSSCVLTCTNCKIKDSCPFYEQEEVIKLYCTPLSSIDFYVKDNELQLLDEDSFEISSNKNGSSFDKDLFNLIHKPYSEITEEADEEQAIKVFDYRKLEDVRKSLKNKNTDTSIDLKYKDYVHDDMGWLTGGRYGCVEVNSLKSMDNDSFAEIKDALHDYKYLYNALFIDIEGKDTNKDSTLPVYENDSYVDYKISSHEYDIDFEIGPPGDKTRFEGKTKIKVPQNLKLFKFNDSNDDVYLVSDDFVDKEGLEIVPCIYLGKVGTIKVAFDYSDDGYPLGITDKNDTKLYAKDIAQWCANYYKGCLAEDPIGYTGDQYKDRDQYWMETVYKKINGTWCEFPGRRRVQSGFMDPITDTKTFDEASAISGHPVVNTYVDFVRKVSIQMYDETIENEEDRWLVPFVNKNMTLPWPDLSFEQNVEIQRKVLTLMKTNLRLVVVKQLSN